VSGVTAIVGEWFSAPSGRGRDLSRTTADRFGNTWFTNRAEAADFNGDGDGDGSITRVGVIRGGTRVDADGSLNPTGDYLAAPFAYNTCVDRDADGAPTRASGDQSSGMSGSSPSSSCPASSTIWCLPTKCWHAVVMSRRWRSSGVRSR